MPQPLQPRPDLRATAPERQTAPDGWAAPEQHAALVTNRTWCVLWGVVALAATVTLTVVFVGQGAARLVDQASFLGSFRVRETARPIALPLLRLVSVWFVAAVLAVLAAGALYARRWGDAVRAVCVVAGANLTTQALKALVERPYDAEIPRAPHVSSLPSGHTTVGASLAAAALIVAPRRARPLVAVLGLTYALAMGLATVGVQWHRPSDVIAAFAVVTAWALGALAVGHGGWRRCPTGLPDVGRRVVAVLLALFAAAGLAVGLAGLVWALSRAGGDLGASSAVLAGRAPAMCFVTSSLGIIGAGCAAWFVMLLARR